MSDQETQPQLPDDLHNMRAAAVRELESALQDYVYRGGGSMNLSQSQLMNALQQYVQVEVRVGLWRHGVKDQN